MCSRLSPRKLCPGVICVVAISVLVGAFAPASAQTETELVPDDPYKSRGFGASVAIAEGRVLVAGGRPSAPNRHLPPRAYVFIKTGDAWVEEATLVPFPSDNLARFCCPVAFNGEVAAIAGEVEGFHYTRGAGRVMVFRRHGTQWTQEAVLMDPDSWRMGRDVALSGNTLAIGGEHDIWIYTYSGSEWQLQKHIDIHEELGEGVRSLDIEGDCLALCGSSHIHTYVRSGSNWEIEETIDFAEWPYTHLYADVSLSYPWIAVGLPLERPDETFEDSVQDGAVYLLKHTGGSWVFRQRIGSPSVLPDAGFGDEVELDSGCMVVSESQDEGVYLFQLSNEVWSRIGSRIETPEVESGSSKSSVVAIDSGDDIEEVILVVGVLVHLDNIYDTSVAYVYEGFSPTRLTPLDPDRYRLLARMLIGVVEGGGGLIWVPGEGPVPIDPDPFKFMERLSPAERDVVIGLAVRELADLANDAGIKASLEAAGNRAMGDALEVLKAERPAK